MAEKGKLTVAAVLTSKMASQHEQHDKRGRIETSEGIALAGGAVEVIELAGELAIGVVGRVPVGLVRTLAGSRGGLELSSTAAREGAVELIVLGTDAGAVLGADATLGESSDWGWEGMRPDLAVSIPNGSSRAVGGVGREGIVGEAGAGEGGHTDASAAGVDREEIGKGEHEL